MTIQGGGNFSVSMTGKWSQMINWDVVDNEPSVDQNQPWEELINLEVFQNEQTLRDCTVKLMALLKSEEITVITLGARQEFFRKLFQSCDTLSQQDRNRLLRLSFSDLRIFIQEFETILRTFPYDDRLLEEFLLLILRKFSSSGLK